MDKQREMKISNGFVYQAILDFSQDLDVGLLDRIVAAFFAGAGQEVSRLRDERPHTKIV